MAELSSVAVEVRTDPHIHAVEAVRELAEVIPDIIAKGEKVEIDFSTMHSTGMTSVRRAVSVTFSRDDE